MCKVIDVIGDYKILFTGRDYIVKNIKGKYKNHGHFKKENTCYVIIRLMKKKQIPRSPYMIEAARRIAVDTKYIQALENKQESLEINLSM